MDKKEAIAVLSELGINQLVSPNLVLLEQRQINKYQLQIRGDFNRRQIEVFLRKRKFSFEMNNDYLIISKS